jgi:hypothetical protein
MSVAIRRPNRGQDNVNSVLAPAPVHDSDVDADGESDTASSTSSTEGPVEDPTIEELLKLRRLFATYCQQQGGLDILEKGQLTCPYAVFRWPKYHFKSGGSCMNAGFKDMGRLQ